MTAPSISLLLSIPNELLHETATCLLPKDVNAFMRTNQRLHHLLAPLHDHLLTQNADHVLSWAVANKKEQFFEIAVSRGADPHHLVPGSFNPPLFFAVTKAWDSSVKLLIDNGAHGIGDTHNGHSALHIAVLFNHLSTTRLLLDRGWSPSLLATGVRGTSPLHVAIESSSDEIIELLIERGADVNARDRDQSTLESTLKSAARPAHGLLIIKMILANGFDTSIRNSRREPVLASAFREAVGACAVVVAKYLLEQGADINHRFSARQETALHAAIRLMDWPMAEMLVNGGIEINARNREKETALFGAAVGRKLDNPFGRSFRGLEEDGSLYRGRPRLPLEFQNGDRLQVVKLLLDAGIDVNARDHEDQTVFFRAVGRGSTPILELLLHHGADIHAHNNNDCSTALHAAAGRGGVLVVQWLLANGSDINARMEDGSTALHIALQYGDRQSAKILLENGIDISILTNMISRFDHNPCIADGATALYLAVRWGRGDAAKHLLAKGARVDVQYHLKSAIGGKADESLRGRMVTMFEENGVRPLILCEGENGDAVTGDKYGFTHSAGSTHGAGEESDDEVCDCFRNHE